jgi:hypothetical protein
MRISAHSVGDLPTVSTPFSILAIGGKITMALIEGGNASFMDMTHTLKHGCYGTEVSPNEITVACDGTLTSILVSYDFSFSFHKHKVKHSLRILDLPHHYVTLGCDWLALHRLFCRGFENGIIIHY